MNTVLVFLAFVCISFAIPNSRDKNFLAFTKWQIESGVRFYGENIHYRYEVFYNATQRIQEKNEANRGAKYALNTFSGMTAEEFHKYPCGMNLLSEAKLPEGFVQTVEKIAEPTTPIPTSWDWSSQGFNTPVKDQRFCGSCGAFSAIGAIEGGWVAKGNEAISLSEQQILDCGANSQGCNGNLPAVELNDLIVSSNGAVSSDAKYSYQSGFAYVEKKRDTCQFNAENTAVTISGFKSLCNLNSAACTEAEMANALFTQGPLSVCLDAAMFQEYSYGILNPYTDSDCSASQINHCVTLVGYGVENNIPYWKVKNSWGPKWGENGHARIVRGTGACGINKIVTAPTF